ncbi:LacI family DNA-binding transcriptional regulator [Pararobbsia alpina]|uniref:Putative HTH-type transcriptional repressor ExuR n=1 Tax=Pararobbsia alpina TaxID=621374 RepID=A0A6S7AY09_9BURK|nr:LacI family DNA-binding transcriptional regulator [Pararobbsia alpina]CAB3781344.1 putative HTH-type transcriptional repressor ExuR [Pararobbsia alpina]
MTDGAPGRRPATAHEVAKLAGVSQSAVSRVFTPGASVAPATRERVVAAASQLGYRPNLVARSLITRRSNLIGVVVPGNGNPFYQRALEALSVAFAKLGYGVLLFTTDPLANSDPILDDVLRYRVDALVLISTSLSSRFAEECVQVGLPVVMFNRKTDSNAASSVTGENRLGAELIAEFLLAAKHRRYAYVAGLEQSSTSRDREEGFMECLARHNVKHVERQVGHYSASGAEKAVRALLGSKQPPDAIFCANDHMALAAISVARAEFGLQLGSDVSIVGFDNIDMGSWPLFSLTTYSQPVGSMVERTVDIVARQLAGDAALSVQEVTCGQLIVRDSARKPKSGLSTQDGNCIWTLPQTASRAG